MHSDNEHDIEVMQGKVILMQDQVKAECTALYKGAASNDEKMTHYESIFQKHEQVITQLQLDLTAKTSRLEGAITGAYAAMQTRGAQGGSGEGGRRRIALDNGKKFEAISKLSGNE